MGALDNLIKGAAGQAVQNMNILFGLKETEGLEQVPMFPQNIINIILPGIRKKVLQARL